MEKSFHLRKILRLAGISPGAGQRELKRLSDTGLVLRTVKENQVLFQANPQCPIFDELKSLITKTAGVVDVLRAALAPLAGRLSMALLYGSVGSLVWLGRSLEQEQDPRPSGCRKLSGKDKYRLRQGDYRIVYAVDDSRRIVEVYKIGNRREIYRD